MRRLQPPTLAQWACTHRWRTTTTRPGTGEVLRVRYLTCRRCGLRVKSEERLAVPWGERDLVALVKGLLPEGQPISLRNHSITALPVRGLNDILARHGLVIRAMQGRFELRRIAPAPPSRTSGRQRKGR